MRVTAIAALPHFLSLSAEEAEDALYETYRQLGSQLGVQLDSDRPPAHNLLLTRQWLLIVPLSRESHLPINVNALGFADRTRKTKGSNPLSSIF
ncbi:phosphorylase [Synechococcus elongatus IITB7]|uniref:phosphorylase n=1 Tax=Synechococcus elongatus TaxID=32046 RepID=UPI0030CC4B7D